MLFVCYILLNTQNIPINGSEKSLVTYLLSKKEQQLDHRWVLFTMEVINNMDGSLKTKSTKSKAEQDF